MSKIHHTVLHLQYSTFPVIIRSARAFICALGTRSLYISSNPYIKQVKIKYMLFARGIENYKQIQPKREKCVFISMI